MSYMVVSLKIFERCFYRALQKEISEWKFMSHMKILCAIKSIVLKGRSE